MCEEKRVMYSQKFATAIKVAGKVLRENGETVALPFGAEYAIHLKNLNSVRALVSVEIDGVDATGGTQLIVAANGTVDFERFIKDGNFDKGLRFRFIERTKKIEDGPRGIGAEDGLIRIQFEFEQQKAAYIPGPVYGGPVYRPSIFRSTPHYGDLYSVANGASFSNTDGATLSSTASMSGAMHSRTKGLSGTSGGTRGATAHVFDASTSMNFADDVPKNDVGITVGGSVSDQKFTVGAWFPTDGVKHVMILKLLGQVGEKRVKEAVTVKTKQECPTCGTQNKFGTKFCKECGTGLTIV
jgi:hypothetical protein